MFLEFQTQVENVLTEALKENSYPTGDLSFEEGEHADLASSIAFKLRGPREQNPARIASRIKESIDISDKEWIGRVEQVGPYINFFVSRAYLDEVVRRVLAKGESYGQLSKDEKVILEHTSANPNGPLHVGHIRNSVIGDTLARILKKAGYQVETQYYVNDMGRQIAVVAWGIRQFGLEDEKPDHAIARAYIKANRAMEEDPAVKEEIDGLIKQYEVGDPEVEEEFREYVELALAGIRETLERMNIEHDRYVWEGEFVRSGAVQDIIDRISDTGYTEVDEGALQVDLSEFGVGKELVVRRGDGTSLYVTRDLAYHEWKAEHGDRVIDVFGADHKLVSEQLKLTLSLIGIRPPETIIFEFVSLPEGSMSTRRGQFISADELLDKVLEEAYREVSERRPDTDEDFRRRVARMVGVGAIRYDIIRVTPEKSTVFDWREALDFEKLSAPFIQYSHARASSILEKADGVPSFDPEFLVEEHEVDLIRLLGKFDHVVDEAAEGLKPHAIATYARELAEGFNQFYRLSPVLNAEPGVREARLALVAAAKHALANTLDVLGIEAPKIM